LKESYPEKSMASTARQGLREGINFAELYCVFEAEPGLKKEKAAIKKKIRIN